MQRAPRSTLARAQAAICVLAVTVGLTVAPALVSTVSARGSATAACTQAQSAAQQAQKKQAAAQKKVVAAKKALAKAKKATVKKAAKVKKAKKALAAAEKAKTAAQKTVRTRQAQARTACTPPKPPAQDSPAVATGKKLGLLGAGSGLPVGDLSTAQLTALLEQLLPGVTQHLDPAELAGLLAGFQAGSDLDPTDALALLSGVLDPSVITQLLAGSANPAVLTALVQDIIGQLSGLGGGLPIPSGFDPAGLWDTFAGIFGALSADQLGSLLSMVTSALGLAGDDLDLDQLTDLIDSLVPGISSQFDAGQLSSMLAAVNGGGLSASTLANLLGGQFSAAQLQSIINGTGGQALLGTVLAQVMAQLGTAGGGGLELPGPLGADAIADLISTVTDLLGSILGGGGVVPVVCGLIPIPVLCP